MNRDFAANVVRQIYPRMRILLPHGVRGVVLAGSAAGGIVDGDLDIVIVSVAPISQRMRLRLEDGGPCDVFVENVGSIQRAIERGYKDHVVRMVADGTVVVDELNPIVAGLQKSAREALSRTRPASPATILRAMSEPEDLLRKLERHRAEPVTAQLLYGQLLIALLRARLDAENRWSVPTVSLLEENHHVDPAFAAWVAVSTRRPFNADMLPAIRERVRSVTSRFPSDCDVVTVAAMTPRQLPTAEGAFALAAAS